MRMSTIVNQSPRSFEGGEHLLAQQKSLREKRAYNFAPESDLQCFAWRYYQRLDGGKLGSQCVLCGKKVNSIHPSSLVGHLRTLSKVDARHKEAFDKCMDARDAKRAKKGHPSPTSSTSSGAFVKPETVARDPSLSCMDAWSRRGSKHAPTTTANKAQSWAVEPERQIYTPEPKAVPSHTVGVLTSAKARPGTTRAAARRSNDDFDRSETSRPVNKTQPLRQEVLPNQWEFDRDITLMVLLDNNPVTYVERVGFVSLVGKYITSRLRGLVIPSVDSVRQTAIHLHQECIEVMQELLGSAKSVSIAVQGWSSNPHSPKGLSTYLAVTAHFSVNFEAHHLLIGSLECKTECKNDISYVEALNIILQRVGIQDRIISVVVESQGDALYFPSLYEQKSVSDEAIRVFFQHLTWAPESTVGSTGQDLGTKPLDVATFNEFIRNKRPNEHAHLSSYKSLLSFTTTLPCPVQIIAESLNVESLAEQFPAVKNLCSYSKDLLASESARSALRIEVMKEGTLKRESNPGPSWNSLYYLLSELRSVLDKISTNSSFPNAETLKNDLDMLNSVGTALKPFCRYSEAWAGDLRAQSGSDREAHKDGISSIAPVAAALMRHITKKAQEYKGKGDRLFAAFYENLEAKLTTTFQSLPGLCFAATLLDPRYRAEPKCFLAPRKDMAAATQYIRSLTETLPTLGLRPRKQSIASSDDLDIPDPSKDDKPKQVSSSFSGTSRDEGSEDEFDLMNDFSAPCIGGSRKPADQTIWEQELKRFSNERLFGVDTQTDPLSWWKENQEQYPTLAVIAEALLPIPASSATSSRIFMGARKAFLEGKEVYDEASEAAVLLNANSLLYQKLILKAEGRAHV